FNEAYGLVGAVNSEELIVKHILDSVAPIGILYRLLCGDKTNFADTIQIADVGSGAGLPGIPLAIALSCLPTGESCNFSLIERMGRRVGFLHNVKAVLSLDNITIEESEVEKIKPEQFSLVVFRAFKPLEPKLLKTLLKVCAPGGIIAAYKGKSDKIDAEMTALQSAENKIEWEAIPYTVPFLDEQRHILVIRK
ncbi:MAG: 16S rRNA (guanine(527)-N(7))-methyltransferase RsmG, partial [Treponema sp.]|nr:16S rRNA (guanine(527)-N(7))-methyltransferase RsmG [Treponema sp.]